MLQQKHGLSHEEIAERLGLDRSTVTNTLRLLRLPPEVQQMIAEGAISAGHARALLGLESAAAQLQLAHLIVKQGLSVRQVENLVALRGSKPAKERTRARRPSLTPTCAPRCWKWNVPSARASKCREMKSAGRSKSATFPRKT